jgi:hypothetical protein
LFKKLKERNYKMKLVLILAAIFIISADTAAQWQQVTSFDSAILTIESTGSESSGNDVIFVGLENEGVWRSTDGGETWTETALNSQTVFSLVSRWQLCICRNR